MVDLHILRFRLQLQQLYQPTEYIYPTEGYIIIMVRYFLKFPFSLSSSSTNTNQTILFGVFIVVFSNLPLSLSRIIIVL